MVNYYTFDVTSNDGNHLIYPINMSLIYHIKYEWLTANKGLGGGVVHAVCVCKSDSIIPDLTAIRQSEYDAFDAMFFTADKTQIDARTDDGPTMTVTLPDAKGTVLFKYTLPDKSVLQIVKRVNESKQAVCGPSDLNYFEQGEIIVMACSDTWFTPHVKRPEVSINAV